MPNRRELQFRRIQCAGVSKSISPDAVRVSCARARGGGEHSHAGAAHGGDAHVPAGTFCWLGVPMAQNVIGADVIGLHQIRHQAFQ